MSDENINLVFGIFIGIVAGVIGMVIILPNKEKTYMEEQAVEKGYGEYVIEEKEIVFRWLDK